LRGRAARAQGRLQEGHGHDRGRRVHRLRPAFRRPAGRRALPAHGGRGPTLQRALRPREPAPGGLALVHAVGALPLRRAVPGPRPRLTLAPGRRAWLAAAACLSGALVAALAAAQPAPREVRMAFLGDTGSGDAPQKAVAAQLSAWRPEAGAARSTRSRRRRATWPRAAPSTTSSTSTSRTTRSS